MASLYDLLGVRKTATARMIRKAADLALAKADQIPDPEEARQRRSQVRGALAVLSDRDRRLEYDARLLADLPPVDWSGGTPPPGFVPLGEAPDGPLNHSLRSWMGARVADSWRGVSLRATGCDLRGLHEIPAGELWALDLADLPITDDDLAPVTPHVGLIQLSLEGTRVTDQGIVHLLGLTHLRHLDLDGAPVGDGAAEALAELGSLQTLSLMDTRLTDVGVVALSRAGSLRELHLRGVPGISLDAVLALARLPHLSLLSLPKLGRRERKQVEAALQGCTVIT
jgi:hypothetical protein